MSKNLQGTVASGPGASSGIGEATAAVLADEEHESPLLLDDATASKHWRSALGRTTPW